MTAALPVVAIDGPSGSGKSTVARAVARRHSWRYVDTGAMYRALAWGVLDRGLDPTDSAAVESLVVELELHISVDPDEQTVRVGDVDVTAAIRSPEVTAVVSETSAVKGVREVMVARQRALAKGGGIVMEGRDIGTTVLPEATLKVFLTAASTARSLRRAAEAGLSQADVDAAIAKRDKFDSSRAVSPLATASDAVVIDSTALDVDAVVAAVEAELAIRLSRTAAT